MRFLAAILGAIGILKIHLKPTAILSKKQAMKGKRKWAVRDNRLIDIHRKKDFTVKRNSP